MGSEAGQDRTNISPHTRQPYPWEEGEVAGYVAVAANDLNYCSINKVVLCPEMLSDNWLPKEPEVDPNIRGAKPEILRQHH